MKKIPAVVAVMITSIVIVLAMMLIGVNAFLNPDTVAQASAPAGANAVAVSSSDSTQIQQLQARIAEYQSREQQYQDQLNQVETSLQQANSQLQQYQQLVDALQQMGLIRVNQNGQIFIGRFSGNGD
jgi:peptidoglycan hydrolase CwlO-like protein